MEEDIKILKAFRNYNKFYKEENGKLLIAIDLDIKTELDKAIENLLTRYKQLEEENDKFRNGEIVTGKLEAKVRKNIFRDLKDYIHKSKIKEKIEELEKENEKVYIQFLESNRTDENLHTKGIMLNGATQVLQELLEEE